MASQARISEQQLEANRANAQSSTGPRTLEGKRRSSLNSLKLGIYSQTVVLPGEDAHAYAGLFRAFVDQLLPDGPIEKKLVETAAQTQWRLDRCAKIECSIFAGAYAAPPDDAEDPGDDHEDSGLREGQVYLEHHRALEALSRQTTRLQKMMSAVLKQLAELQAIRRKAWEQEMLQAVDTCIYMEDNGMPFEPADHGFDFPKAKVQALANRKRGQKAVRQFHADIAAIGRLRAVDRLATATKAIAS